MDMDLFSMGFMHKRQRLSNNLNYCIVLYSYCYTINNSAHDYDFVTFPFKGGSKKGDANDM